MYMRARAMPDILSLSYSMMLNGVPKDVRIVPNADAATESRADVLVATLLARQWSLKKSITAFVGGSAGGFGVLANIAGLPSSKAVGVPALTCFEAALSMRHRV
jgi:hypothetical protein